jgi:putative DNA primase/helicase
MTLEGFIEEIDPIAGPVLMRDFYHPTDLGNSERFVDRYGDMVCYCAELSTWFIWTEIGDSGGLWAPDTSLKIRQLAKATVLHIIEEVPRLKLKDRSEERAARITLTKWAYTSENSQRITAMLFLAQSDERVSRRAHDFNADPWLLNCQNGTLDLRTRELRDAGRENLITRIVPVAYDEYAVCEEWDERVKEVLDENKAAFLQRACGSAITGINRDKALFVLFGKANARKSTLLDAIFNVIGDYAAPVNIALFARSMQKPGGTRADLISLEGVRAAQCSEIPRGMKFNDAFLKSVTGTRTQSARGLFEKRERKILPQTKFFIETNFLPEIEFDDEASFNRFHIIPFLNTIPLEDCDPSIKEFLIDDVGAQEAVLAWCVDGCYAWQETGLKPPEAVNAARREYQESMNPLASFIASECMIEDGAEVVTSDLWKRFDLVASPDEHKAVKNPVSFGKYLTSLGFKSGRITNARTRRGIRLRDVGEYDEDDDDDDR